MKTLKKDGKKVFSAREYLKHTQIMAFFSRLSKNRAQVMAAAESESEGEINEDDLNNEAAQQEMEQIVKQSKWMSKKRLN